MNNSSDRHVQTTIRIDRSSQASFENFYANGNQNSLTLFRQFLTDDAPGTSCYLWGARGTGKSHLLFAACQSTSSSVYIPILDLQLDCNILTGLEDHQLVCIDDIHSIAGQSTWEERLLALLESVEKNGNLLIMTGNCPPSELNFELKDLVNRLRGRQVLKLNPVSDQTKIKILVDKAAERGLPIDSSVAEYILRRYSREMHALVRLLDRIVQISIENRRRITIPFLRNLEEFKQSA